MIRSIRKVMNALMKEQLLNDEGLNTLMCEIESILNSRPLTKVSDDQRDASALTPNHLLLLKANHCYPPGLFSKNDRYSQRRWKQVQFLADSFWKRWIKLYLPTLQIRQKWLKPQRNLQEDDIVLMVDNSQPRGFWPLGRVLDVNKGRDGLVRSARVKTASSEYVRPIDKLCLLEGAEG